MPAATKIGLRMGHLGSAVDIRAAEATSSLPAWSSIGGRQTQAGRGTQMSDPIQIRMGGYGPATTGFSRALQRIGDRLAAQFGDRLDIKYVWNIMELGYKAEDILWLVEHGLLTLGYQSSSYLTDRVPELGFVDLPFLFASNQEARAAVDGALGQLLARKIEERVGLPDPRLFRERLSPSLQPAAAGARAGRSRRHADQGAAEPDPGPHLRAPGRGAAAHGPDRGDRQDRGRRDRRAGEPALQHRHLRGAQVPPLPHADQPLLHLAADFPAPRRLRRLAGRSARRHAGRRDRGDRVPARAARARGGGRAAGDRGAGVRDRRARCRSSTPHSSRRCSRFSARRGGSMGMGCSSWPPERRCSERRFTRRTSPL